MMNRQQLIDELNNAACSVGYIPIVSDTDREEYDAQVEAIQQVIRMLESFAWVDTIFQPMISVTIPEGGRVIEELRAEIREKGEVIQELRALVKILEAGEPNAT